MHSDCIRHGSQLYHATCRPQHTALPATDTQRTQQCQPEAWQKPRDRDEAGIKSLSPTTSSYSLKGAPGRCRHIATKLVKDKTTATPQRQNLVKLTLSYMCFTNPFLDVTILTYELIFCYKLIYFPFNTLSPHLKNVLSTLSNLTLSLVPCLY